MYSAEFQIFICCLHVVFVDQKLEVFTLMFPQIFWVAGATSWPHCSLCFYCFYWGFFAYLFVFIVIIVTRVQVGSSKQRGVGQAGSGRSFPPNQDSLSPGQVSLSSGVTCPRWHQPAEVAQGTRVVPQCRAGSGTGSEEEEGRCSPRAITACSCSLTKAGGNSLFLGLSHSYSHSKQFCFSPSLLACYLCSTSVWFPFYHSCENAEGMSVHICS